MKSKGLKIYLFFVAITIIGLLAEPVTFYARTSIFDVGQALDFEDECPEGMFFIVKDIETGEEVFHTGRFVYEGDLFQTADNRMYEVVSAEDFQAQARLVGHERIEQPSEGFDQFFETWLSAGFARSVQAESKGSPHIVLYHSHSGESYLPTDGSSSIRDNGGIYKVGESFKSDLEQQSASVTQSRTSHDPHDSKSYIRSRRTAQQLLRENPAAVFDLHRDALERRFYMANVEGEDLAQVLLVVGRQNPNMRANKQFAQELKALADEKYPGLIRGIFFGRGGYNQDLAPRSLLLEFGTHKNSREEAKKGAALFADVVGDYLGTSGAGAAREGVAAQRSLFILLALLIVGGLAYLYMSTGSVDEMISKIRHFVTTEFSGKLKTSPKPDDET